MQLIYIYRFYLVVHITQMIIEGLFQLQKTKYELEIYL